MYLHIRRAVFAFSLMAAGCSSGGQETSNSTTLALAGCAKAPTEGKLVVHFNAGYTAVDVAEWLAGWSCRGVIVPRHLAGVQAGSSFDETVELADHAGLLDRLLAKLDLVAVSDEKSTVIVERQVSAEAVTGHVRLSPVNPPKPAVEPPSRDRRTPSRTSRFDDATKKLLEEGISKTADYQYTVSAAVRDEIIENPVKFARGARIVPSIKNGKPVGGLVPETWTLGFLIVRRPEPRCCSRTRLG